MPETELLQMIENLRAVDASPHRLFGDAGQQVPSRRGRASPQYLNKLAECAHFVAEILEGKRPYYHFQEAMTTADFPLLFGDVLDRQLLASYREAPATYRSYCRISQVPDFRNVSRFAIDGADGVLDTVAEKAEYPETDLDESRDQYQVAKRGRRIPISWESIVNDDMNALRDIPARLGRAARRSEEKFATELFAATAGPSTNIYTTARDNLLTTADGAALSIATLQIAFQKLAEKTDPGGEPILTDAVHLVVPPALEVTAMNILNGLQLEVTEQGGTTNQTLHAVNWMRNRLTLHVNRYLPIVSSGGGVGNTSWYLFGNPTDSRPALEMGFLRGHQEPEIWIKRANAMRAGGGDVMPLEGDFDTDAIQYRVRHVFGGTALTGTGGWRNTVAFSGTT